MASKKNYILKKEHVVIEIVETIQKNCIFYSVEQSDGESREVYLDRVTYIANRHEKNPSDDLTKIVQFSYIWRNVHCYGMSYPNSILKLL